MSIPWRVIVSFWGFAFVASGLLGLFCFEIHTGKSRKEYPRAVQFQQIWFNFAGAMFGWAALWFLVSRAWFVWRLPSFSGQATFSDVGLAFVAFVGISGYLPFTADGAIRVLHTIAVGALNKLLAKVTEE